MRISLIFAVTFLCQLTSAQSYQWTWLHGDTTSYSNGVYGNQGMASATSVPGARMQGSVWKDLAGNLWLFGGYGYDEISNPYNFAWLNDLWKYDPTTNQWTWIKGSKTSNATGVYGIKGVPDPLNNPVSGQTALTWTDNAGNLWLFGGFNSSGYYNSLWKYNIANNQWTWMHGDKTANAKGSYGTMGVSSPQNKPKARLGGVGWKDLEGNFWLFGGWGDTALNQGGRLNDLWKYNVATNEWTWMKGDSTLYNQSIWGTKGVESPNNKPGSRIHAAAWTDANGKFWIYGGDGMYYNQSNSSYSNESYDDLWKFDPVTNNWTWVSGNVSGPNNSLTPGSRMRATAVTDANGDLVLFGGAPGGGGGCCFFNNVWKYNISSDQWTKIRGSNITNPPADYGIKGIASPSNDPFGLSGSMSWGDASGNIYVFGGVRDIDWPEGWYNTLMKLTMLPLPVNLISFDGIMKDGNVVLTWSAENEVNFDKYEVQRSTDGRTFTTIGIVRGEKRSIYNFIDKIEHISSSTFFYRLKLIDKDGKSDLSKIISFKQNRNDVIQVYPNPSTSYIALLLKKPLTGKWNIKITDMTGKSLINYNYQNLTSGIKIPISVLSAGSYTLLITNNIETYHSRFVVR